MKRITAIFLMLTAGCRFQNHSSVSVSPPLKVCSNSLREFGKAVWAPLVADQCYGCHQAGGVAQRFGAHFVLEANNLQANFKLMQTLAQDPRELLLKKPTQQVAHYGGAVIAMDSPEYRSLQKFVESVKSDSADECAIIQSQDILDHSQVLESEGIVRKAALRLVNRLPTKAELDGGLDVALNGFLNEAAFFNNLMEFYNQALGTDSFAVNNVALSALVPNTVVPWYEPKEAWANPDDYVRTIRETNKALARTPLQLIRHVVAENRNFQEVLTAPYRLVNPYSACILGIQNQVKFSVPVSCKPSEASYPDDDWQEFIPDAHQSGLLTDPIFLRRHPTTATNRNRHRANTITTALLGVNILDFSKSRLPPSSVMDNNPTMSNRACTVCHAVMDPIAGTMQNWNVNSVYQNKAWYTDMFASGYKGEAMPADQNAEAGRWLAGRLQSDPRFAFHTVRSMARLILGIQDIEVPSDPELMELYLSQQHAFQEWSDAFVANGYKVKDLIKTIVKDPVFAIAGSRADANHLEKVMSATYVPERILSPQQLDRKITNVLGRSWSNSKGEPWLLGPYFNFYGGVDSESVTESARDFSGLMSQVSLRMASEMSCLVVPLYLGGDTNADVVTARHQLMPDVNLQDDPEKSVDRIKQSFQLLHHQLLGENLVIDGPEIKADWDLFQNIVANVKAHPEKTKLPKSCQQGMVTKDPTGTVQAWTGVFAVLLADQKFLTE